jgi:hypothetical protein
MLVKACERAAGCFDGIFCLNERLGKLGFLELLIFTDFAGIENFGTWV